MTRRYRLAGLNCAHCGTKIERAVGALSGVNTASLALATQTLTLQLNAEINLSRMDAAVASIAGDIEAGVQAICMDHDDFQARQRDDEQARRTAARREGALIAAGVVLLALGAALERWGAEAWRWPALGMLALSYLILGFPVLLAALRAASRRTFDEQLLMAVASMGAIALGEVSEAAAVMLFYRVGEWLQDGAVNRSRGRISALMALRPDTAHWVTGDAVEDAPAHCVVAGDLIEVRPGERVPLDGVVLTGRSDIDASALTGESLPVSVGPDDEILAGSVNLSGVMRLRALRPASQSAVARIMDLTQNAAEQKAASERWITRFASLYTPAVIVLAGLIALVPGLMTGDFRQWVYVGLMTLMLSCPCALVISAPLTFFTAIGAASRRGILFKGGQAIEAMAAVDAVAFDKTGTLTAGTPTVSEIRPVDGFSKEQVIRIAAMCEAHSAHPVAQAILAHYGRQPDAADEGREWVGEGVTSVKDGVRYGAGNARLAERMGAEIPGALTGMPVYVMAEGRLIGAIALGEIIRPEAAQTLKTLRTYGVKRFIMLTGDALLAARKVQDALRIDDVRAELLPEDKVASVAEYKRQGRKVAFVGDGINDAPVLALSDAGVVMGASGRQAAIEAGDIVLMRDSLSGVAEAMRLSRKTMRIFKQNIALALFIKLAVVGLGMLGHASMFWAIISDVGAALLCVLNAVRAGR